MSGRILVIPPDQSTAQVYEVSQDGYLAVIATLSEHPPDVPPPPPNPAGLAYRVRVPRLNVRSGPSLSYPDVGDLYQGDVIAPLEFAGADVWLRFAPGKWTAVKMGVTLYLEQVGG